MFLRTDLAVEAREITGAADDGVDFTEEACGEVRIERMLIKITPERQGSKSRRALYHPDASASRTTPCCRTK